MADMISTYDGKLVDPRWLEPGDISFEHIAHSLSQRNRWVGCTEDPYSVAQHSVWMCDVILAAKPEALGVSAMEHPVLALFALLDDAPEAYWPDFPGPQKHRIWIDESRSRHLPRLVPYEVVEARCLSAIFKAAGVIDPVSSYRDGWREIVHEADMLARTWEIEDLIPNKVDKHRDHVKLHPVAQVAWLRGIDLNDVPAFDRLQPMLPKQAEAVFLCRLEELQTRIASGRVA